MCHGFGESFLLRSLLGRHVLRSSEALFGHPINNSALIFLCNTVVQHVVCVHHISRECSMKSQTTDHLSSERALMPTTLTQNSSDA